MRTPEEKTAQARAAARTRWQRVSEDERRSVASELARQRWAGHERTTRTRRPREPRPCKFCGEIVPMAANQVRCSRDECRLAYNAERMRTRYAHLVKAQQIKRQARLDSAEPIDKAHVFERDGWICGICAEGVDPEFAYPDPMSASLDHVVPLSKGGTHTLENVRCSHLVCNQRRGNRDADLVAV